MIDTSMLWTCEITYLFYNCFHTKYLKHMQNMFLKFVEAESVAYIFIYTHKK